MTRTVRHAFAAALLLAVPAGSAGMVWPCVAVAQGGPVVLDDVTFNLEAVSYRAPHVEFRGTALSREDLQRLLDPSAPEGVEARLAKLSASEISIPELTAKSDLPGGRQTTVYRDVLLRDVANGRIGSISVASGTVGSDLATGPATGGFGTFTMQDIDASAAVALYRPDPDAGTAPIKRLYGAFSLQKLTFTDAKGMTTNVDELSGKDFSARPTREGWMGTVAVIGAKGPDAEVLEARQRRARAAAEFLDSVSFGTMEMKGVTFAAADRTGGRIERIGFTGATAQAGSAIRLDNMSVDSPSGRFRLSSMEISGISLAPTLAAMRDLQTAPDGTPSPAQLRAMVPAIGNFQIGDLSVDVAAGPAGTGGSKVSIGRIELASGKPVDGIPTDMKLTAADIAFPVPSGSKDENLQRLSALGYEKVSASVVASLGWNEASKELALRELSFDGAEMGSVIARGTFGNVPRDAFNPDRTVASVALLGVTAKGLEIGIEDRGFTDRLLRLLGRQNNQSPEDLRRSYGTMAAIGIPAMLGGSPGARTLGQAVSKFIARPHRLLVAVKAKAPAGFGISDYAEHPSPSAIVEQLDIAAQAD